MSRRFDLHLHTTASDGRLTPEEVLSAAAAVGLQCLAITDHDTTDAVDRAVAAGKPLGLPVIPGAEFSAEFEGELHILGYGIDIHSAGYGAFIARQQRRREERNAMMLARLGELGITLPQEFLPQSAPGTYGRMHMARGMVAAGVVETTQQAFERYLGHGAPAYVYRRKFSAQELIGAIRACGGQAVLAHPGRMELGQHALRALVKELTTLGLAGLEVFYPTHSGEEITFYTALAAEHRLVCTYGSDWHGGDSRIAARFEDFSIPEQTYQWIEELQNLRVEVKR